MKKRSSIHDSKKFIFGMGTGTEICTWQFVFNRKKVKLCFVPDIIVPHYITLKGISDVNYILLIVNAVPIT